MADVIEKQVVNKNIKKTLEKFAQENSLEVEECDFKLLKTDTYIKTNANKEFENVVKNILEEYINKDRIINENVEFQQHHSFIMHERKECKLKLDYTIEFDEQYAFPKIVISPKSIIPYKLYKPQELLKLLYVELNKIKAYNGILVRIFDETMIQSLKVLIKYIYNGKFVKKVKINLFDGEIPVITQKSSLIYWFKEKERELNSQVIEVDGDELLIEYKKPIFGKKGFNSFGNIIDVDYVTNNSNLDFSIDEKSIYIKEDQNSIKYITKKRGYVDIDQKHLCVKNKITLQKISRNAPSIDSHEDNDIEVSVSQYDTNKDSVGEGVVLNSKTVHIDGFVGSKSVIKAINLDIDGATHQDSKQFAKFANINRHKGTLRCHHAKIKLLEGGEVHATNVEIEASLGGSIYAKDVIIGHVKNNLKVYASNSITIRLISGEDNVLKVGYQNIPILKSKMDFLNKDIEDLKESLEDAKRNNLPNIIAIKNEIQKMKKEVENILFSYKDAKITIEQPLKGLNHIIFKINDENELIYKTDEKKYEQFYLEFNDNDITLLPVKKSIKIKD